MTASQIIDQANRRTEFKGKVLDLKTEFASCLKSFCLAHRWHWRRLSYGFATIANQPEYDLKDSATVSQGFVEGVAPQKFLKNGVRRLASQASATGASVGGFGSGGFGEGGFGEDAPEVQGASMSVNGSIALVPVFAETAQDQILESVATGAPCDYFVMPGTDSVLYLYPTPNGVYRMRASFWAVAGLLSDPDQLPPEVPLVPTYLHHLLVKCLEVQILRFTIGEGSTRYTATKAEYDAEVRAASAARDFADGRIREFRDQSRDAVQSSPWNDTCW